MHMTPGITGWQHSCFFEAGETRFHKILSADTSIEHDTRLDALGMLLRAMENCHELEYVPAGAQALNVGGSGVEEQ